MRTKQSGIRVPLHTFKKYTRLFRKGPDFGHCEWETDRKLCKGDGPEIISVLVQEQWVHEARFLTAASLQREVVEIALPTECS